MVKNMGTDDIKKKEIAQKNAYRNRKVDAIPTKPRILIMCEGEKTEPNYFGGFKLKLTIETVKGGDALLVVEQAMKYVQKKEFDEVWCVFDRDFHPEYPQPERFYEAISKIERFNALTNDEKPKNLKKIKSFNYAYSNDAFELWYILHYDYMHSSKTRQEYADMLSIRMGKKYKKNDPNMYDNLIEMQSIAIRNATKLLNEYPKHNPEKDNPSTTVHMLVQELNKYIDE
jgi:hypothetical protein